MPLTIIRNDITRLRVDAIVNAANTHLRMGGGVCGAIFSAAGPDMLQRACDRLAPIQTGEAVITKGFALPAKYIIHTAGPVYRDGKHNEYALLCACYTNALHLAKRRGCTSVAFPLLSSGIFGYPKAEALTAATCAIRDWLLSDDMDVSLVVYDKASFVLSQALHREVKAFIDDHYVRDHAGQFTRIQRQRSPEFDACLARVEDGKGALSDAEQLASQIPLPAFTEYLDESFSAALLRMIDAKGKTDVYVYKHANMDRKLFSKIRKSGYMPSKKTAVALAVALELSLEETRALLESAGFALSRSILFDVIIEHFITRKMYDIFEINNTLFEYDEPLLGG